MWLWSCQSTCTRLYVSNEITLRVTTIQENEHVFLQVLWHLPVLMSTTLPKGLNEVTSSGFDWAYMLARSVQIGEVDVSSPSERYISCKLSLDKHFLILNLSRCVILSFFSNKANNMSLATSSDRSWNIFEVNDNFPISFGRQNERTIEIISEGNRSSGDFEMKEMKSWNQS